MDAPLYILNNKITFKISPTCHIIKCFVIDLFSLSEMFSERLVSQLLKPHSLVKTRRWKTMMSKWFMADYFQLLLWGATLFRSSCMNSVSTNIVIRTATVFSGNSDLESQQRLNDSSSWPHVIPILVGRSFTTIFWYVDMKPAVSFRPDLRWTTEQTEGGVIQVDIWVTIVSRTIA